MRRQPPLSENAAADYDAIEVVEWNHAAGVSVWTLNNLRRSLNRRVR